ncbi:hypothetical protein [Evansella clarkii]|uniref:hypothetical protein n=1 Tax=Evansella clarkii TaxID=79879 RepID=UPI000996714F|nr:hypothetical protein [Evansella clarkii]
METIITKDNLNEAFERMVVGLIRAENYNQHCFGMSDLRWASAMDHALDTFIEKVIEAGYCHHAILGPTLVKYDYTVESPKNKALKTELDDSFQIDMSDYQQALSVSYEVFDSTVEAIQEGAMPYR